jgi:TRAP-type C4-dicarboxylate transport system permease small subunit
MKGGFNSVIERLSKWMQVVSGAALVLIMLLTVADVCLRNLFRKPIIGTYEFVGIGGAIVIGFALPITSWLRGHIFVDFFVQKFSRPWQTVFNIATRLLCMGLFILIFWNFFLFGQNLYQSGEVTPTRHLPFYPVAYGLGVVFVIQCFVFISDIIKVIGGKYE